MVSSAVAHHQHQQQQDMFRPQPYAMQQPAAQHPDHSMVQLPQEEKVRGGMDRVRSISLEELYKIQGGMTEMVDSFSKMSTGNPTERSMQQMNMSQETMGTIEHMATGSVADMSIGTMGNSTFSIFSGNESAANMDERIAQVEAEVYQEQQRTPQSVTTAPEPAAATGSARRPQREPSLTINQLSSMPPPATTSNASMSLSDVWGARRKSSAASAMSAISIRDDLSFTPRPVGGLLEEEPPQQGTLDDMGLSSISLLKSAFSLGDSTTLGSPHSQQQPPFGGDKNQRQKG